MVEESAGTRMYESKRLIAEKTIEKKDAKLEEMTNVSFNLYLVNKNIIF